MLFRSGGSGIDTALFSAGPGIILRLNNNGDGVAKVNGTGQVLDQVFNFENIFGSETGNDKLTGNKSANLLDGQGGNDHLSGLNGNDVLRGGGGNDKLVGGNGRDRLEGGNDNDRLSGNNGNDTLIGGNGNDGLNGGNNNDNLSGNNGNDTLVGGNGNDNLNGGNNNDILDGGTGKDVLTGGNGSDTFVFKANSGADTITDFDEDMDAIDADGAGGIVSAVQQGDDTLITFGDGGTVLVLDTDFMDFV